MDGQLDRRSRCSVFVGAVSCDGAVGAQGVDDDGDRVHVDDDGQVHFVEVPNDHPDAVAILSRADARSV